MIGVGFEATEARSMTSEPTDWHQTLARVNSAEEDARTLEAQNNTLRGQLGREKEVCHMSESVAELFNLTRSSSI
jgi:hypothetical protein